MVCTRNEDCDTADCDITQSPFDDYTLSMTLLSCREPRPGMRVVARDGGGQVVLNTTVDESQSGIELSSEAYLDITRSGSDGRLHRNCSMLYIPAIECIV